MTIGLEVCAKGPQHTLGVVARRNALHHCHGTIRAKPCQKHSRLHLRRGHGQLIANTPKLCGMDGHGKPAIVIIGLETHQA